MKRTFFFFIMAFMVVATVCYVIWLFGDAMYNMYKDRRLGRELDELEKWARDKKQASSATGESSGDQS